MAFSVSLKANLTLAITHAIAINRKEKYDADCPQNLRFCADRLGRLLPGFHLGQNFGPLDHPKFIVSNQIEESIST